MLRTSFANVINFVPIRTSTISFKQPTVPLGKCSVHLFSNESRDSRLINTHSFKCCLRQSKTCAINLEATKFKALSEIRVFSAYLKSTKKVPFSVDAPKL